MSSSLFTSSVTFSYYRKGLLSCFAFGFFLIASVSLRGHLLDASLQSNRTFKNDFQVENVLSKEEGLTSWLRGRPHIDQFLLDKKRLERKGEELCVIIRSSEVHTDRYQTEFFDLIQGFAVIAKHGKIQRGDAIQRVHLFVSSARFDSNKHNKEEQNQPKVDEVSLYNPSFSKFSLHYVDLPNKPKSRRRPYNATYPMLQYILDQNPKEAEDTNYHCDRFLITRNDSQYHDDFLMRVNKWIREDEQLHDTDLITFQSQTLPSNEGDQQELVESTSNKDLDSVIIKRRVFEEPCEGLMEKTSPWWFYNAEGKETSLPQDWLFMQNAIKCGATKSPIPEVLVDRP